MGYTTEFDGSFKIQPPLTPDQQRIFMEKYYEWNDDYDDKELQALPEYPIEGYNQWVVTEDGGELEWDGEEKFYDYVQHLETVVGILKKAFGAEVSGSVRWRGEDFDDQGVLTVRGGKVTAKSKDLNSGIEITVPQKVFALYKTDLKSFADQVYGLCVKAKKSG